MNQPPSSISRRDFLSKTVAGAGAGLVLGAPNILRAADAGRRRTTSTSPSSAWANRAGSCSRPCQNIPGLHFQAVCDIWDYNRQGGMGKVRALQDTRPKAIRDIDEMLATEKGLDAAIVATPDFWHSPAHREMPRSRPQRLLREDDVQHHRRRPRHGQGHGKIRQTLPDRPPAPQQPALPLHARPADQRPENLRPDRQCQRPVEPRGQLVAGHRLQPETHDQARDPRTNTASRTCTSS